MRPVNGAKTRSWNLEKRTILFSLRLHHYVVSTLEDLVSNIQKSGYFAEQFSMCFAEGTFSDVSIKQPHKFKNKRHVCFSFLQISQPC